MRLETGMEQRRNKFAYDRDYYRSLSERMTSENGGDSYSYGSAARKLNTMTDPYADEYDEVVRKAYEELYAEPLYDEPIRQPRTPERGRRTKNKALPYRRPELVEEPKVKVKKVWNIDIMHVFMLLVAVAAMVFTCYRYLESQSNLSQMGKQMASLETKLSTLNDKNRIHKAELNQPYDSDYIFSYAVSRLGMVYPNSNEVITYDVSDKGYVRQYEEIEESDGLSILDVIAP